jgi:chaperonin cofactor prefoldin
LHDLVIVGVPLLAIFAGTLFNNQSLARLETRIESRLDKIDARIDRLQAEMTVLRTEMHREFEEFYRTLGQHDARIDNLEKQRP